MAVEYVRHDLSVLAGKCAKIVTSVWGTSSETYQKGNRLTSNAKQQRHRKLPSSVSTTTMGSSLVRPPINLEIYHPFRHKTKTFWIILLLNFFFEFWYFIIRKSMGQVRMLRFRAYCASCALQGFIYKLLKNIFVPCFFYLYIF